MMKSTPSLFAILITCLTAIIQVTTNDEFTQLSVQRLGSNSIIDPNRHRNELLKRWLQDKPAHSPSKSRFLSSPFDILHTQHQFKGCLDPSEPFQCPQSEQCIALQFICDGHPNDCPSNIDENEETCIAAKRPAKENIEKFLNAEYALHNTQLFAFLFGEQVAKGIEENSVFWFDALASAFSVAKNLRGFTEKMRMSSSDRAHFRKVFETIHDGRLEELPMFAQEAVTQGLASLIEKLYESGFMEQ